MWPATTVALLFEIEPDPVVLFSNISEPDVLASSDV